MQDQTPQPNTASTPSSATLRSCDHQLVGYPCNQEFDYSALLPFLSYSANNVGDPFHDSNFP